jgi:hypothetical protein
MTPNVRSNINYYTRLNGRPRLAKNSKACCLIHPDVDGVPYPSNTFLLLQELIKGVHHFGGGSKLIFKHPRDEQAFSHCHTGVKRSNLHSFVASRKGWIIGRASAWISRSCHPVRGFRRCFRPPAMISPYAQSLDWALPFAHAPRLLGSALKFKFGNNEHTRPSWPWTRLCVIVLSLVISCDSSQL